jgi:hypothetical protein
MLKKRKLELDKIRFYCLKLAMGKLYIDDYVEDGYKYVPGYVVVCLKYEKKYDIKKSLAKTIARMARINQETNNQVIKETVHEALSLYDLLSIELPA